MYNESVAQLVAQLAAQLVAQLAAQLVAQLVCFELLGSCRKEEAEWR